MLLLYILWDDCKTFMISGSNQQLQQELKWTLLKPDCHRWWISKIMQSGHEDTLEERCGIKFCFKLVKRATETYGMLQNAFRPSWNLFNDPRIFSDMFQLPHSGPLRNIGQNQINKQESLIQLQGNRFPFSSNAKPYVHDNWRIRSLNRLSQLHL